MTTTTILAGAYMERESDSHFRYLSLRQAGSSFAVEEVTGATGTGGTRSGRIVELYRGSDGATARALYERRQATFKRAGFGPASIRNSPRAKQGAIASVLVDASAPRPGTGRTRGPMAGEQR